MKCHLAEIAVQSSWREEKNTCNINQLANKANRSYIANEILPFGWLLFCVSLLVFRCAKGRRYQRKRTVAWDFGYSQNWLQCWKATFCPFSIPTTILWYSLEFSTYYVLSNLDTYTYIVRWYAITSAKNTYLPT